MKINEVISPNRPTLYMPIGPSGAGKSTHLRRLQAKNPNIKSFSLDELRHEWYDPKDYRKAWQASVDDKQFPNRANQRFIEMIKKGTDIYVDNTNLTPKKRRFFIEQAKKRGYQTVAFVLPVDYETLVARQKTRTDKEVPEKAVKQQLDALKGPVEGEFDSVETVDQE